MKPTDREKLTDTLLHVESARSALDQVEDAKVPKGDEVEECLENAQQSLREALGYLKPPRAS